jgi:hypothetical protein
MTPEEGFLFKCFDTRMDDEACRRALHASFRHPGDNGPPRESCELRAFCFWEDEVREGEAVEHAFNNSPRAAGAEP